MDSGDNRQPPILRRGAVAVVYRSSKFLVIRRSDSVEAPGAYCFPGGAVEPDESHDATVRREMFEELGIAADPVRQLWSSVTSWNVQLSWWLVRLNEPPDPRPNPQEVASIHWLTSAEMRALPDLLESNRQFLDAWQRGEFELY